MAARVSREGLFRPHRIGIHRLLVRYLVDANVLSEATRPEPSPEVVDWLRRNERDIAVDPVILGEIRFGILLLPRGKRRIKLERWFDEGVKRLRCLPWEAETGLRWAELLARLRAAGRAMPVKDSLIAATALVHGLTVVTRNTSEFQKAEADVFNPFRS
ncbi:MAG: type II toxin-antitoxin system VapC family toxin [Vicinamibacteria bacterium]